MARTAERLLNLVIALLATDRYIGRERIRELVQGYDEATSDVAFQRMFERDKQALRELGISIQVGATDPDTDELDGYRISRDDFSLSEIQLTPHEARLVGLAASVWNEPTVAAGVAQALTKVRAGGGDVGEAPDFLAPRLAASEPGFPHLWEALLTRAPVAFTYHGRRRTLHCWKLILRSGAWYVVGEEQGAGVKIFRLNRMEDRPRLVGDAGSYALPPAGVIAEQARRLEPGEPTASVPLAIRAGTAGSLRRRGGAEPEWIVPEGYEAIRVPYAREDEIVAAIAAAGPDVLVLEPGPVRDQVLARLRAWADGGRA